MKYRSMCAKLCGIRGRARVKFRLHQPVLLARERAFVWKTRAAPASCDRASKHPYGKSLTTDNFVLSLYANVLTISGYARSTIARSSRAQLYTRTTDSRPTFTGMRCVQPTTECCKLYVIQNGKKSFDSLHI